MAKDVVALPALIISIILFLHYPRAEALLGLVLIALCGTVLFQGVSRFPNPVVPNAADREAFFETLQENYPDWV